MGCLGRARDELFCTQLALGAGGSRVPGIMRFFVSFTVALGAGIIRPKTGVFRLVLSRGRDLPDSSVRMD
jgi:hypothetical protein